jgi:hypothetical protein
MSSKLMPKEKKTEKRPLSEVKNIGTDRSKSGKTPFSWSVINLLLDLLLFATFVWLAWLSIVTQFLFPRGATGDSWTLLGYGVNEWRNLQFWTLAMLAGEIVVHVMLHWTWVCGVVENKFLFTSSGTRVKSDDGIRTLIGVSLLAATLLFMGIGLGVAAYFMRQVE